MNEEQKQRSEPDENLADYLGFLVRDEWIEWASEQLDADEHPHWTVEWEDLPERDKEVDRRIGMRIAKFVQGVARGRMERAVQQAVRQLLDQGTWESEP
jgi:hypothetical protein